MVLFLLLGHNPNLHHPLFSIRTSLRRPSSISPRSRSRGDVPAARDVDLFRGVTVTAKGFTFTAKAIRVVDDGKVVTFFVVD
jgi:hypothetical protein